MIAVPGKGPVSLLPREAARTGRASRARAGPDFCVIPFLIPVEGAHPAPWLHSQEEIVEEAGRKD